MATVNALGLQEYFSGITQVAKDISSGTQELLSTYGTIRKVGIDAGISKAAIDADVEKARIDAQYKQDTANARSTGNLPVANFLKNATQSIPAWVMVAGAAVVLLMVMRK